MSYPDRILRVMLYVQSHLDDELSLEHLAGVACFSPCHFHRVFRGMTGEPVAEYVRRLRLERAAARLKATAAPVTELAFEAGYDSHEGFTRAFSARFGLPPTAFRQAYAAEAGAERPLIVRLPERHVFFVRHVGPYPEVGAAWARLFAVAGPARLLGPGLEYFGICHDDPEITAPERLRYDAALTVRAGLAPPEGLQELTLVAREYATIAHLGPYSTLDGAYARLCGPLLAATGREPASAPALEFYRNDPRSTPPERVLTEIFVPLD